MRSLAATSNAVETKILGEEESPATFLSLPTEIHFRIAHFLPDHALHILGNYRYSARLRYIYRNADPHGCRNSILHLSDHDYSIYQELKERDAFDQTGYPQNPQRPLSRIVWSRTPFHCLSCNKTVLACHFPKTEMEKSMQSRTGMSRIIERQCFAELTPVKLWDDRIVSWSWLQEVWAKMDPSANSHAPVLVDNTAVRHGGNHCHNRSPTIRRYTSKPDTLTLRDLDHTQIPTWIAPLNANERVFGVEATAEYYIDLYTQFRWLKIDASEVATTIKQKQPYLCPHFDLGRLMYQPMSRFPLSVRPAGPGPLEPGVRVVDLLVGYLNKHAWAATGMHTNRLASMVKGQDIQCGRPGCRTRITIQRYRDCAGEEFWSLLKDLVRLKVVRKWRIDRGTGDAEWQAQNGTTAKYV